MRIMVLGLLHTVIVCKIRDEAATDCTESFVLQLKIRKLC